MPAANAPEFGAMIAEEMKTHYTFVLPNAIIARKCLDFSLPLAVALFLVLHTPYWLSALVCRPHRARTSLFAHTHRMG